MSLIKPSKKRCCKFDSKSERNSPSLQSPLDAWRMSGWSQACGCHWSGSMQQFWNCQQSPPKRLGHQTGLWGVPNVAYWLYLKNHDSHGLVLLSEFGALSRVVTSNSTWHRAGTSHPAHILLTSPHFLLPCWLQCHFAKSLVESTCAHSMRACSMMYM